jgi:hypothetical protein
VKRIDKRDDLKVKEENDLLDILSLLILKTNFMESLIPTDRSIVWNLLRKEYF